MPDGEHSVSDSTDDKPHVPAPSLWPIGFAVGVASVLVGLVVSWPATVVGAALALVFGALWVRDIASAHAPAAAAAPAAEPAAVEEEHRETYGRAGFLSLATVGLGGVIGAGVALPSLGFAVLPSFAGETVKTKDVDLGPITNFPEGTFVIATFMEDPGLGEVSRRTAYVRNNGLTRDKQPSFTILFSRCVHLGCPVQPNGPIQEQDRKEYTPPGGPAVELQPVLAASFGCPCHGGQYDGEGNRTAGPPVRSLDRFEFSIVNGNLIIGRPFSVGTVEGAGAGARIAKYRRAYPGVHVDGIERWLYPIPVPGS
ncbi:Rieske [2Fe-2S] domain-containing protein [Gaiella occulta]|uniref:Cytochrome bc1 complex Rieske iron-sulfur subunit n=1 Tax=Gaiella occulta TaxID=1002870 RepID=A0A7M2YU01_9ACTN|nr:Rieske [2Fe-2S] domain-containing protein [Gaiella occulta]